MNKLLILSLLAVFVSGLLWIMLVPIFHTPDEQAHFGETVFIAEKWRIPNGREFDLTEEIYIAEQLLGTARDKFGNNRFTFHPEYKIEYTDTYVGKYEKEIINLNNITSKKNFVHVESAHYPKLYYLPAALLYKLFYSQDLFTRIFVIRLYSLLLFMATVYLSYKVAAMVLLSNRLFPIIVSCLVGFQPMMVFSNIGVNSDALGNLIFTSFILFCLQLIHFGLSKRNILLIVLLSSLAVYAKPQFIVTIPIIIILFIFIYIRDHQKTPWLKIIIGSAVLLFLTLLLLNLMRLGTVNLIIEAVARFNLENFIKFTKEYTLTHTVSEVLPWYWGIYDWLGVTYGRTVHRIINRIVVVSLVGFLYWFVNSLRKRNWKNRNVQSVYFLIFINIVYFTALSVYDWFSWYTTKYQLGIQGRYYFPLIASHMIILLIGWYSLFNWTKKLKYWSLILYELFMISLNFIGLYTIVKTYYALGSFDIFIKQASQYKPWFTKGNYLLILWSLFFVSLIFFLFKYIFYKDNKINETS